MAFPGILHIRRGWFDRVCFAKPHQNPNQSSEGGGGGGRCRERLLKIGENQKNQELKWENEFGIAAEQGCDSGRGVTGV